MLYKSTLFVDAGNTFLKIYSFKNDALFFLKKISVSEIEKTKQLENTLSGNTVIFTSCVNRLTIKIKNAAKKYFEINSKCKLPFVLNQSFMADEIGPDIIAATAGVTTENALIIGAGTANFYLVKLNNTLLAIYIVPGFDASVKILNTSTDMINIDIQTIDSFKSVFDTKASVLNGLLLQSFSLVDTITKNVFKDCDYSIVMTGNNHKHYMEFFLRNKIKVSYDAFLVPKGILNIYNLQK